MSDISKEEVKKLGKLARISLTEEEVQKYQKELSDILHYVEKLNSLDTENIEPTFQVTGLTNVVREDEVKEETDEVKKALIDAAPSAHHNHIAVKEVIKKN